MYVILSLAPPYNTYRKILITSDNHLTLNFHAANLQKASRNMEEHFNYVFFFFVKITPQHLSIIPPSTSLTRNWNSNFQSCMVMHVFFDSSSKLSCKLTWPSVEATKQHRIKSSGQKMSGLRCSFGNNGSYWSLDVLIVARANSFDASCATRFLFCL